MKTCLPWISVNHDWHSNIVERSRITLYYCAACTSVILKQSFNVNHKSSIKCEAQPWGHQFSCHCFVLSWPVWQITAFQPNIVRISFPHLNLTSELEVSQVPLNWSVHPVSRWNCWSQPVGSLFHIYPYQQLHFD